MKTPLDRLPVACAALSLLLLTACGDELVGHWKGEGLDINILEPEDNKYKFTGTVDVLFRECALEGTLVLRADDSYSYEYNSAICNFPGEGECILDQDAITLTCTPDNAPEVVLNKLEE